MRIALAHDYLVQCGGAEKVLECFCELFPYAPIYTIVYDENLMHGMFKGKNIKTSYLQKIPFAPTRHRIFPPLMPMAIEQFDFSQYDIVLSDSSAYAKGIITGPETLHTATCTHQCVTPGMTVTNTQLTSIFQPSSKKWFLFL